MKSLLEEGLEYQKGQLQSTKEQVEALTSDNARLSAMVPKKEKELRARLEALEKLLNGMLMVYCPVRQP